MVDRIQLNVTMWFKTRAETTWFVRGLCIWRCAHLALCPNTLPRMPTGTFPPFTVSSISAPMPDLKVEADTSHHELPRREIGGLFRSEMWWRDRYRDFEAHGYRLRNRYHPDWNPSWKRSGKDFFDAEDGQPSIVSIVRFVFALP